MYPSVLSYPSQKGNIVREIPGRCEESVDARVRVVNLEPKKRCNQHGGSIGDTVALSQVICCAHLLLPTSSPVFQPDIFEQIGEYALIRLRLARFAMRRRRASNPTESTPHASSPAVESWTKCAMIARTSVRMPSHEFERLLQQRGRFRDSSAPKPTETVCTPVKSIVIRPWIRVDVGRVCIRRRL